MSDDSMPWIALFSALLDALIGLTVLFVPRAGSRVTLRRVFWAAAAVVTVFAGEIAALRVWGLDVFGVIHLAYAVCVVGLPLWGVGVLVFDHRRRKQGRPSVTPAVWMMAAVGVAMAPVGVYATFIEPYDLQLEQADIPVAAARRGDATITIGVLSDLQTAGVKEYDRTAVERLMRLAPDLILVPGDLFQGSRRDFDQDSPNLVGLFSRLSAPGGVYVVTGNCDRPNETRRLAAASGLRFLDNEIVQVRVRDREITVAGVGWNASRLAPLVGRLEAPGSDDIRILLTHTPDAALHLSENTRVDLVVAGHTHGGQVRLPWFGPPITFSRMPRHVAAGGLHEVGGRRVYVSRGVGWEQGQAPRIRFLCPPEISLLRLGS